MKCPTAFRNTKVIWKLSHRWHWQRSVLVLKSCLMWVTTKKNHLKNIFTFFSSIIWKCIETVCRSNHVTWWIAPPERMSHWVLWGSGSRWPLSEPLMMSTHRPKSTSLLGLAGKGERSVPFDPWLPTVGWPAYALLSGGAWQWDPVTGLKQTD